MKSVNHRYQEYGEAFLFFLHPMIDLVNERFRDEFRERVKKRLEDYTFKERKNSDPSHPESVVVKKEREIGFESIRSPEDIADALITALHGYYLAPTQNRIKHYIEDNL